MDKKFDLIVVGGGLSGTAAAISAAREGLSVLLIDRNNCLGGAATECLVNPFMPYWTMDAQTNQKIYLSKGMFSEILDELKALDALGENEMKFSEEYLKLVLNRMVSKENIQVLFNTYLIDAEVEDGNVKSVTIVNKSGKQKYFAAYFVDATGDGDLSVMCGCGYRLGREEDNLCQPMTLCFRVAGVDTKKFLEERPEIQILYKEYRELGRIKNCREDVLTFLSVVDGVVHFNSTRIVKKNPVDGVDVTQAEMESREQAFELFDFLKQNFTSFKKAQMLMTASRIGVRESRMIEGEYVLTQEDLLNCVKFEDSIAVCNYEIDIHNPEGSGTSHYFFEPGEYYTIPYRCITPKSTNNLLTAGRCISSTHEAQASYRIMPTCTCIGQAAGFAAAIAKKSNTDVKNIDVEELKNKIIEYGGLV